MTQTTGIKVYTQEEGRVNFGLKVAEGWRQAYNCDTKRRGALELSTLEFYHTLPLNEHRRRSLAEILEGERDETLITNGYKRIIDMHTLSSLTGFDEFYCDMINQMYLESDTAYIEVVIVDPSYGCHMIVKPHIAGRVV